MMALHVSEDRGALLLLCGLLSSGDRLGDMINSG